MGAIKNLWQYFDGKKTIIASIYWGAVIPSLLVIFPQGTPPEIMKPVTVIGLFLTSMGLGHKFYKRQETENDFLTRD